VTPGLVDLVSGAKDLSFENLDAQSAPGIGLSQHAIEAIRAMSPNAQGIVVGRLAGEIAQARTIDKALLIRRLLLTGARVPEVAGYKVASNRVGDAVAEIEKDIDNLLFEADVRQKVVSNTLQVVLARDEEIRKTALAKPTAPTADRNPLVGGAGGPMRAVAYLVLVGLVSGIVPLDSTLAQAVEIERTRMASSAPRQNEAARAERAETARVRTKLWDLSVGEYARYETLMQGIRGSISPSTLSPIEVLGIHARDDEERRRYAETWAQMLHEDVKRIAAFDAAYSEAVTRLGYRPKSATRVDLRRGDRIMFFASPGCARCVLALERLLGYGSSRQGCESWRVKVPLPSVARNGRLVYPLLGEVTN
jgi:hypothetical protein